MCQIADVKVVVLSTGFAVHPVCWPSVGRRKVTNDAFGAKPC